MTRRRHFPSILLSISGDTPDRLRQAIGRSALLHADAILIPTPWRELPSIAAVLGHPPMDRAELDACVGAARRARLGVFLEVGLPSPDRGQHTARYLSEFRARHIHPLWELDLAGVVIRSAGDWPADAILEFERFIRLTEGAVLFVDHGVGPDHELLDGQVDGVVDPVGVAGISRFLTGRCSGYDLEQFLVRQQHRLGINLAGRVLNPIERLNVPAKAAPIGIGLAYMLRGYPMVDDALADDLERVYGPFGQLRRQLEVLEWGRFVPMTPADRPEVLAFARADERVERPLLVIARREAGAALSLPLGVGRFNPDKPFRSLMSEAEPVWVREGWLDLPPSDGANLLVLAQ